MDDGFVDLSADGFDAGIRLGEQVDADMIRRRITGPIAWQIVASPDYLARCGTPTLPEELINHNCITYRFTSSAAIYRWELVQGARTVTYSLKGALVVNDAGAKCTAARQGLGLAYDLKSTFADDVARGALVPVLERFCQVSEGFFLYYPARRQVMPKLRAFIDVVSRHQFSL
jgi:DNA-binding transcriptional LysR family regulator